MNKKGIIVSGGSICDEFAIHFIQEVQPDYIIGVDSGLEFLYRNDVKPTHIVGDFDSVSPEVIGFYKEKATIPIQEFNPVKDATDTEIAVRLAIELGVNAFWVLGATGTRLDHVVGNIQILKMALDRDVKAWIVDAHNRISLWKEEIRLEREFAFGKYFSLFPFGEEVKNVSIEGAKYPLNNYHMTNNESRCVSNEYKENEVVITFSDGIVVLMETRDC